MYGLQGVGSAAKAAKEVGAERFVLVSSALVTPKNRFVVTPFLISRIYGPGCSSLPDV